MTLSLLVFPYSRFLFSYEGEKFSIMTHTATMSYILYSNAKNVSAGTYSEEVQIVQYLSLLLFRDRQAALANILRPKKQRREC